MEVEKKRSKGSFFHLFDWHGKSRKKLFANNNEPPDESKEGRRNVGNAAKFQSHMSEVDETAASINNKECSDKGSCEFNYASSMDSDEGVGTKAPGVVARLMGLESLPTSNTQDLQHSSTFSIPHSHRGFHHERVTPNGNEYYPTEYLDISSKLESFSGNLTASRTTSKVQNRPIERFQIETLPPKSAKSIPGTHHRLLSPIRSPGFVLTKNAAYIMEAAARMIEPSPPMAYKGKESSIGSSSVPLRIQKLKERLEAAHRASNPNISNHPGPTKYSRGLHTDKNKSVAEGTRTSNASGLSEKRNLGNGRNKVKSSSSLAVQAKTNVHNREASTSSSTRSSVKKKERSDAKVNQPSRSSPDRTRTVHKETSTNKTTAVLRHNNQKQNCKDNATSRTSAPNQQGRKIKSTGVSGANRKMNKVVLNSETGSKRADAVTCRTEKEVSSSRLKKLSGNKQCANGDLEERVGDNISIKRGDKSIKCNVAFDGDIDRVSDSLKNDMDVISFTFSSPIMRKMPDPQSSGISSFDKKDQTYSKKLTFDSNGFDAIRSDTLNALLEQKIRELTCKVESSQCSAIIEETSCSTLPDQSRLVNEVATSSAEQRKILSNTLDNYCSDSFDGPDWLTRNQGLNLSENCQITESEVTEEHSTSVNNDSVYDYDCANSSPVSITDPSFSNGSFSDNRNTSNGGKQFSWQEQEPFTWLHTNETQFSENETQLCDTASSFVTTFNSINAKDSNNWELVYVRVILNNADLMLKELTLGQTEKIITPELFNQLENTEYYGTDTNEDDYSKLGRKALFDCVSECLESWFGHVSSGSFHAWAKCSTLIKRKEWLAEESYKEILSWKNMKESMEDELVDKDMSSRYGKWLDFDKEAHEEGVVIGDEILTCLVEDLVCDLFLH